MAVDDLLTQIGTLVHVMQDDENLDEYGDPTETTTTTEVRCLIQQNRSDETDGLGQVLTETWSLFLPSGTIVDGSDRITVDGATYELVGPPWPAWHPTRHAVSHIEATVERTQ